MTNIENYIFQMIKFCLSFFRHSPNPSPVPDASFNLNTSNESEKDNSASGEGITLRIGTVTSHGGSASKENSQDGTDAKKKFTTSNFTETVVTESDPVFGTDSLKTTTASSESTKGSSKKRKSSVGNVTPPVKTGIGFNLIFIFPFHVVLCNSPTAFFLRLRQQQYVPILLYICYFM